MNIVETGDALAWLMAAGAAIWLGIGCYLALLAARQRGLARTVKLLENMRDERE